LRVAMSSERERELGLKSPSIDVSTVMPC